MNLCERFEWYTDQMENVEKKPKERYQWITQWAGRARGINPRVFDQLSELLSGCGTCSDFELAEREALVRRVLQRFSDQNRVLRAELNALAPSGVVNPAVFDALTRFDDELAGRTHAACLREAVEAVFQDFRALRRDEIRGSFAGGVTGACGTDTVEVYGYINVLEECDASVQWALFMPGVVEAQQQNHGIRVKSFEYCKFPALRFLGVEADLSDKLDALRRLVDTLNQLGDCRCGLDDDMILLHHWGKGVDVEPCHGIWGRFFQAGTPVPDGMTFIDFLPQDNGKPGVPYLSQFAFAQFAGNVDAMHCQEGFDCDAMYDITRNIILGQNVVIPYPAKYWTAEVYLNGFGQDCTAYLFSVDR